MKKFIVIALSVGGMSNKIFHSGDEVCDTDFPEGHAESLVRDGFLKPVEEEYVKHILTQEDMDLNPEFEEQGLKVGDEIQLPTKSDLTPDDEEAALAEAKAARKNRNNKK